MQELLFLLASDEVEEELARYLATRPDDAARLEEARAAFEALSGRLESWAERQGALFFGTGSGPERGDGPEATESGPVRVPGYVLREVIGRGGMGVVYRAVHAFSGATVALKLVPVGGDRASFERGLREARTLAKVKSHNVVLLRDSGSIDGYVYLAMDLLEGENLQALIRRWQSSPDPQRIRRAAEILLDASTGAGIAHALRVVHRDIKPSNVFVCADGTAKLTDFGLARGPEDTRVTDTGWAPGTARYMSPERFRASPAAVDPRSDVYSLGATLYEALTLRPPFDDAQAKARRSGRFDLEPLPVQRAAPATPRDLAAVVERAMELESERRYSSAQAFGADLQAFLDGRPVSAHPIGRWGRCWRWARRHRRALTLACGAAVLVIGLVLSLSSWIGGSTRLAAVRKAAEEAHQAAEICRRLRAELPLAAAALKEVRAKTLDSGSFGERQPLLEAEAKLVRLRRGLESAFTDAVLAAQRGLELDGEDRELRAFLTEQLWKRFLELEAARDEPGRRLLEAQLLSHAPEMRERVLAQGVVRIESAPSGAQLLLFRYEPLGALLQPLPFHPVRGRLVELPYLPQLRMEVVRPPAPALAAFGLERGDRVVAIQGQPVDVSGNRLLKPLDRDAAWIELELERGGERLALRFPSRSGGVNLVAALNVCVEADAYPLAELTDAACGLTPSAALTLPAGSYLALLRLSGYRDARVPFAIERDGRLKVAVNLYSEEEIGADMVYVPGGATPLGGDPASYYPEDERQVEVPDFFISRYEVTFGEYFDFLNDSMVSAEIRSEGTGDLYAWLPYQVVGTKTSPLFERRADGTIAPAPGTDPEVPARWISRRAAERFVRWKNDQERRRGGTRSFALPSADEFEKAARGADRRLFPWGNLFDWSLTLNYRSGSAGRYYRFPTDTSPYDVRDLAGCLSEFTRTDEAPPQSDPRLINESRIECRIKGGSFLHDIEPWFHVAGHFRERARDASDRIGFRVVVYPARD